MASPQKENGFTAIAHEIMLHLCSFYITGYQFRVILCILRKTYGYGKKMDFITNSQIIEETKLDKASVSRAIKQLVAMNIIIRDGKNIGFQKDWEQWKELAPVSSKVSTDANNSEGEKLAPKQPELAPKQPELAPVSSKVSTGAKHIIKETITKETIQKKKEFRVKNYPVPEWIDADLWTSFMEVREKKKAVQSEQALKLILSDLTRYHEEGQDVNEILRRSIKGSWKDVYSLKDKPTGSGPPKSRPQPQRVTARTEEYSMEEYYEGLK